MRRLSVVLLVALAVAGCKKSSPTPQGQQAPPGGAEAALPASIQGKVLERLDAPPYSYLRLKTAQGEAWVAVPKTDVSNGQDVTVAGPMPMQNFQSKTLDRKFDLVYFGTLGGGNAAPPMQGPMGAGPMGPMAGPQGEGAPVNMAAQHAAAAAGPADVGEVKVEKAKGSDARTIAEVYAQKSTLKEKTVAVRGKVVKFNEGIMGRNWVHLRDGTGKQGTNDLTVTTSDKASVGDVVTAKGTVRIDKDFGAGYAYPVIVEDASVTK